MNEKDIRNFVPLGRDHAISCRRLAERMGCSERDVQEAVFQARAEGYPVCSTTRNGYFMPLSAGEALDCYRAHASRVRSGTVVLRVLKNYLRSEATRDQWAELEEIERELSGNEKTAYGAGTTTDEIRD